MKTWIWGSCVLVASLLTSLVAGLFLQKIDWIHITVLFFTFYGVAILAVPVMGKRRRFLKNDCYRPFVSVLVPARNEENVIEATVRSLCRMHYRKNGRPNFEVVVIDDRSTDQTLSIVQRLAEEFSLVRVVRRFPDEPGTGKSVVLNEGLRFSKGEIIAVFDADTRVEPNFLLKTVAYLYDPEVGGVQGRVRIYNPRQNLLTSMQEDEFSVMAHLVQLAKDALCGMTALGGNGQLTRRDAVEKVGGWNELSSTEDLDLTIRLLTAGYGVRYSPEAILWQEAVPNWSALLRQRVRWAEGFIKCLFDYTIPLFWHRGIHWFKRVDGFLSLIRVLLPMWVVVAYIAMGAQMAQGLSLDSEVPTWLFMAATWSFFAITFACIYKVQCLSVQATLVRVAKYWVYNFIWVVAVPIGFVNCLRNLNTIQWDKTVHRGDLPLVAIPSAPPRAYRQATGSTTFAEVIE